MSDIYYDWLEFRVRPKKDGLHDSGYRYISVTGVNRGDDGKLSRTQLHEYADHVMLAGITNIDVEADGTIRLRSWSGKNGWKLQDGFFGFLGSDARFVAKDVDSTVASMRFLGEIGGPGVEGCRLRSANCHYTNGRSDHE